MDNGASSYRRYLDGDETAFEQIVKEYREPLTLFIAGITRDYHAAEDVAIDVFAELAVNRRYNFKVTLKTYLYMLGRSRAIDYIRHRARHATVALEDAEPYLSTELSVDEDFLRDEQNREVRKAIAKLPEKMRTVIYLVYFEQLSYEEAARVMKLNKKQVDNLLYRAKAELRSMIVERGILK
ncbi:MAG: sigma-70 family RNA polymerase sigma factor [Clostridia bacterium]|nr:sigma-70 family RNA polymerase sigma factor [Clostridia bacterium]